MEIVKDIITSILILTCIIAILGIFLYDKVSLSKAIPTSEEYVLTKQMKAAIDNGELEDIEEVIVNYNIDAYDLKKYERENEYNKGRVDPFAMIQKNETESGTSTEKNDSETSGNFYEDDGTK